ncbi:MAG: hypothetical protein IJ427_07215 [Lachnospiraceae bacterium]|nr:hypothetical protein [Lachnospiraceae bacterium]
MTTKLQIFIAYMFHAVLIVLGFFVLHEAADGFLVTAGILSFVYLIFYIIVNRKKYIPWILLLHHLIGSAVQILLHYFEIIPSDGGMFFGGIGQFIYAFFAVPGYFGVLMLTHSVIYLIYKIRTGNLPQ